MNDNMKQAVAVSPLIVPICEKETDQQRQQRWKKNGSLSKLDKELLSSDFTLDSIEELQDSLKLDLEQTSEISRTVRDLVWGETKKEQLDEILAKKFSKNSPEEIAKIKDVILKILAQKPEDSSGENDSANKMSLIEAMREFPGLGEQLITSNPLKLRAFTEMVKPSIKNWIVDYHDNVGNGKHEMMQRGNFLFHGENTKRLDSGDRDRLTLILKSLDDGDKLPIDKVGKKIIFSNSFGNSNKKPSTRRGMDLGQTPPVYDILGDSIGEGNPKRSFLTGSIKISKPGVKDKNLLKKSLDMASNEPYKIPGASEKNNLSNNAWNPAANVRSGLNLNGNENKPKSLIGNQEKIQGSPSIQGKVRFSSPQTLPVEKEGNRESKKETKKTDSLGKKTPQPLSIKSTIGQSKPAFEIQSHLGSAPISKEKILKKVEIKKSPIVINRITPMGFVDGGNTDPMESWDDLPKISGNTVDLT